MRVDTHEDRVRGSALRRIVTRADGRPNGLAVPYCL